jgi:hypothetical protein
MIDGDTSSAIWRAGYARRVGNFLILHAVMFDCWTENKFSKIATSKVRIWYLMRMIPRRSMRLQDSLNYVNVELDYIHNFLLLPIVDLRNVDFVVGVS